MGKPGVRIVHDARGGLPPARGLPAILGFLLVTLAGLVATLTIDAWRWMLIDLPRNFERSAYVNPEFLDSTTPVIIQSVAGGLLMLLGVAMSRLKVLDYVITAALAFSTLHCANLLLDGGYEWLRLVIPALWVSFFVNLSPESRSPSKLGMLGFVFMVAACTGCYGDWFNWAHYAHHLESWPQVTAFFADWGGEAFWGVVLLLTALGVCLSRGRMIHFCNAILLLVLAWYCIQQGAVKTQTFEFANVGVTKTIELQGLRYVEIWRWAMAGEMLLLAMVLLHLALGMGAIAVGFAIAWMSLAIEVDHKLEQVLVTRFVHDLVADQMTVQPNAAPGRLSSRNPVAGNMGLPVDDAVPGQEAPPLLTRRKGERGQTSSVNIGASVAAAWSFSTAILAGLIGAAGLRMVTRGPRLRHWLLLAVWGVLGALLMWLANLSPKLPDQTWLSWLTTWLARYRAEGMIAVAWFTLSVATAWSMRERARYVSWLYCAAACSLIGTILSLCSIAILNLAAGFPPLPVWSFVVIAAGQSSLMWALLMHRNLGAREIEAGATTA